MKNERLISLREERELTQEQLGNAIEASQSMIARIEAGDRDPRKAIKIKLAKFLGVTVEWLFYEQVDDLQSCNNGPAPPLDPASNE